MTKKISLYYCQLSTSDVSVYFEQYLKLLPKSLQYQVLFYIQQADAERSLIGKLLLMKGLQDLGLKISLQDLKYSAFKKPYFEEESIDFNISHSGDYVICAIGRNVTLGVDIEQKKEVEIFLFHDQFSDDEWNEIQLQTDEREIFFKFWTAKEAVIKADGRGLQIPLQQIKLRGSMAYYEHQQWYLQHLSLDKNYTVCIASDEILSIDSQAISSFQFFLSLIA